MSDEKHFCLFGLQPKQKSNCLFALTRSVQGRVGIFFFQIFITLLHPLQIKAFVTFNLGVALASITINVLIILFVHFLEYFNTNILFSREKISK